MGVYVLQADAVAFLQIFDASITTTDVPEVAIEFVETSYINTQLLEARITPPVTDYFNLLKSAALAYLVELLTKANRITYAVGGTIISQLGQAMVKFNRENMFFFRHGDSTRPVDDMRDTFTPAQVGRGLVRAYVNYKFNLDNNQKTVNNKIVYDLTTFGYGWNPSEDVVQSHDDISGGIL